MMEKFSPSIIVDGVTVQPEGWMWVLGFALGGASWAIETASDPAFDLRGKMQDYKRRRAIYYTERDILRLEKSLADAKARLKKLGD